MDLGVAITASTAIIMTGIAVIKLKGRNNKNPNSILQIGQHSEPETDARINLLSSRCDERFGTVVKHLGDGDTRFNAMQKVVNRIDKRVAVLCDRANIKVEDNEKD